MSALPPPRLRDGDPELTASAPLELGRLLIDLTDAALHRDHDRIVGLVQTLDLQEASDLIGGLAVANAVHLAMLNGGRPGACQQLRETRAKLERGELL